MKYHSWYELVNELLNNRVCLEKVQVKKQFKDWKRE